MLRSTAWLELHTWLAAAAMDDRELPPELEPARATYRAARDVASVTRKLARCEDERCAIAATAEEPYGNAYRLALPAFHDAHWRARSETAWAAVEATHAAFGPEAIALFDRLADELETKLPREPVAVGMVTEGPEVAKDDLVAPEIAAKSDCFVRRRKESDRVTSARIVECVLVRTMLEAPALSATETKLVEQLGPAAGARAWSVLVIHAAATMMNAWGRHASVDLATTERAEPDACAWLAKEWKGRSAPVGKEITPLPFFVDRYVTAWKESHSR